MDADADPVPAFVYLPKVPEQEWLLTKLAELVAQRGAEPFLKAPLLEPTSTFFPDDFTPTPSGIRTLAERILGYAGLSELRADIVAFGQEEGEAPSGLVVADGRANHYMHQGAAACFAGIQEGVCLFGVNAANVHDPELLVASLCHEVAHAYRAHHRLVCPDRDEEELLTDLTTIYLGFGVLTLIATGLHRAAGDLWRYEVQHRQLGYLPAEALSFLLAAQSLCRSLDRRARRRIRELSGLRRDRAGCHPPPQSAPRRAGCPRG